MARNVFDEYFQRAEQSKRPFDEEEEEDTQFDVISQDELSSAPQQKGGSPIGENISQLAGLGKKFATGFTGAPGNLQWLMQKIGGGLESGVSGLAGKVSPAAGKYLEETFAAQREQPFAKAAFPTTPQIEEMLPESVQEYTKPKGAVGEFAQQFAENLGGATAFNVAGQALSGAKSGWNIIKNAGNFLKERIVPELLGSGAETAVGTLTDNPAAKLAARITAETAYGTLGTRGRVKKAETAAWTKEGKLRKPTWKGDYTELRDDLLQMRREIPKVEGVPAEAMKDYKKKIDEFLGLLEKGKKGSTYKQTLNKVTNFKRNMWKDLDSYSPQSEPFIKRLGAKIDEATGKAVGGNPSKENWFNTYKEASLHTKSLKESTGLLKFFGRKGQEFAKEIEKNPGFGAMAAASAKIMNIPGLSKYVIPVLSGHEAVRFLQLVGSNEKARKIFTNYLMNVYQKDLPGMISAAQDFEKAGFTGSLRQEKYKNRKDQAPSGWEFVE